MNIVLNIIKIICPKAYEQIKAAGYQEGLTEGVASVAEILPEPKDNTRSAKILTDDTGLPGPVIDQSIIITITQALETFSKKHNTTILVKTVQENWRFQPIGQGIVVNVEEFKLIIQFTREEYFKLTRKDILKNLYTVPENKYTQQFVPAGGYPWQTKTEDKSHG